MIKNITPFIPLLLLLFSCGTNSQRLNSDTLNDRAERVETLKAHIQSFSPIHDAEFKLFNVNGFNDRSMSIPGASSINYQFAIRVDTADVSAWLSGFTEDTLAYHDIQWTHDIVKHRADNWTTTGEARHFELSSAIQNVSIVAYYADGILFKRVIMD